MWFQEWGVGDRGQDGGSQKYKLPIMRVRAITSNLHTHLTLLHVIHESG